MIILNIKKGGWIITKSFESKDKLIKFLKGNKLLSNKIWNLQVSGSIKHSGFVYSMRTKQRQINPVSGVLEWK